ncbi:adenosylcobinamide-GDP ribazoletransferase [Paucibacter sp. KCTC 42545]|uniref:adenosylcobinamide-GDP ribazoletransferase n=1 Tax=Paucibacter sp. KCTC 42545 TaxID=1768242 RepID=UPI000733A6FD|nr:adenosylcobinamide-GDP ribazoletransferase [Paucibacter sp. KCTC 42545]ALT76091.1 cobalamin synthase [Paucibacter sp. KCTC 42545]
MRHLLHQVRLFFIALQFFTRCPVPAWVGFEPAWLQQCARYFPVVGTLVGLFAAAVLWAASWIWPASIAVGLSMAASVWLTGGFHEDGWADTCDGLGGAVSREKALLIMKDSRIGSYGALGLILMLGLKAAALLALLEADPHLGLAALVWAHSASRLAPVWLMSASAYAGDADHAKAKPLATQASSGTLYFGLAWLLLLSGLMAAYDSAWVPGLCAAWVAGGAATLAMQSWLERRLGGYTGDNLGATQQIVELVILLSLLALVGVFT